MPAGLIVLIVVIAVLIILGLIGFAFALPDIRRYRRLRSM
jgi:hypothetical protein